MRHRLGTFLAVLCGASAAHGQGLPLPYSDGKGLAQNVAPPPRVAPVAPTPPAAMPPPVAAPSATETLTARPGCGPGSGRSICGNGCDDTLCCGPVGANGPITYELYGLTGPNWVIGGSQELSGAVGFGWKVGGGGKTLFFNPARDAAWVLNLGASYTYNDGDATKFLDIFTPAPIDPNTGQPQRRDELHPFFVRGLHRSSFDFAIGRDWFVNGPGMTGDTTAANSRFGVDLGGQWGYAHADLIPTENQAQYLRKAGTMHGLSVGAHWSWEKPLGAATAFAGVRGQWNHTWMNIIEPQDANLSDLSLLLTVGLRY